MTSETRLQYVEGLRRFRRAGGSAFVETVVRTIIDEHYAYVRTKAGSYTLTLPKVMVCKDGSVVVIYLVDHNMLEFICKDNGNFTTNFYYNDVYDGPYNTLRNILDASKGLDLDALRQSITSDLDGFLRN